MNLVLSSARKRDDMSGEDQKAELAPEQTQIILDSIADGVFTVDEEWKITSFNRSAEIITGMTAEQAIGRHCWELRTASASQNQWKQMKSRLDELRGRETQVADLLETMSSEISSPLPFTTR